MKVFLVLLSLCFCTTAIAKKKAAFIEVSSQSIELKSIENNILTAQTGSEFHGTNTVLNPKGFEVPNNHLIYFVDGFDPLTDSYLLSENSYRNSSSGGASDTNISNTLSAKENVATLSNQIVFRQGMYYGFALMLVLLNLVCFFLFEEKTFLFYSIALATTSLLLFYSDGLWSLLGVEIGSDIANVQSLFFLLMAATGTLFVAKFLKLEEYMPKLKFVTISALVLASFCLTFAWLNDDTIVRNVTNVLLFSILGTYFMAGVILFSKKNYAKFYVIAAFIPLLFSLDYFVLSPLGINFLAAQTIHIKAATIAEMLIITYAIMYRMQAIKEENALRQAEMRIFLKRQEVLATRKKTEQMMEDVYLENLIMHYDLDGLEIKLLQYISEGKENAKIARKLKSTETEIEEMTKDLYHKLEIGEQIQQDYRMVESQPDYIYN